MEKFPLVHFDFVLLLHGLSFFLFFPLGIIRTVYSVYELSAHQTNALLSEIFILLVTAGCELRSTSYGPKNTRCGGFSLRHFVHNYINGKLKVTNERFIYLMIVRLSVTFIL